MVQSECENETISMMWHRVCNTLCMHLMHEKVSGRRPRRRRVCVFVHIDKPVSVAFYYRINMLQHLYSIASIKSSLYSNRCLCIHTAISARTLDFSSFVFCVLIHLSQICSFISKMDLLNGYREMDAACVCEYIPATIILLSMCYKLQQQQQRAT